MKHLLLILLLLFNFSVFTQSRVASDADYQDLQTAVSMPHPLDAPKPYVSLHLDEAFHNSFVIIIVAALIFVMIFVLLYSEQRRKANVMLKEKNAMIKQQRDELDAMLTEISVNMSYASSLQSRIMMGDRKVVDVVDKVFVIYAPKDVITGDFFYVKQFGDYKVLAVGDCTGHGVSAALLTVMGITCLNEYFSSLPRTEGEMDHFFDPANVLERIRQNVKSSLYSQENNQTLSMSGMDVGLMIHRKGEKSVRFAGANRPLYIVRENKEVVELKPIRNPIAGYVKERNFVSERVEYSDNDMLYLFSDGLTDQFSADKSQSLGANGLKNMLSKYAHETEYDQKAHIMAEFNAFRGAAEQVDDIMLLGVRGSSL